MYSPYLLTLSQNSSTKGPSGPNAMAFSTSIPAPTNTATPREIAPNITNLRCPSLKFTKTSLFEPDLIMGGCNCSSKLKGLFVLGFVFGGYLDMGLE
ncbi:hypothetical protein Scep_028955 [Stephania cephalantha]|uniref:Uncharacterized protein n=1 Tax=Stephania cephalantha TaxID=152367 RepID=A0AAP0EI61_9MAGN